ncbi:Aspartate carbamoyltransferase [Clarias magur]|uniref:Aspartate carbamoyltransferase n=1 Tax=Clarias magur TaxID=1594786 RepID=A0A8J4X7H5_CLAMG|nr:Aspartate carbamoyltransferase [Clarias magur]
MKVGHSLQPSSARQSFLHWGLHRESLVSAGPSLLKVCVSDLALMFFNVCELFFASAGIKFKYPASCQSIL